MAPVFRTPEEVAPELGIRPTTLRRYIKQSGHCTTLGRGKIVLHEDDVTQLVAWIRDHSRPTAEETEHDPFAA